MSNETQRKVVKFQDRPEIPDFVKNAFLIGLAAFTAHIAKELTKITENK